MKTNEIVVIKPIKMKTVEVTIVGDSPLICHAWSEKAKRMMLDAQTGKNKVKKKEIRRPVDEFIQSLYWLEGKPSYSSDATDKEIEKAFIDAINNGAKFGFPVCAIKMAGNSAAYRMGWVKNQMSLRGSYFLKTEYGDLVEIESDVPEMHEDMVKIGVGSADLRYRAYLNNWRAKFKLEYNENGEYSLEDIINVINAGGFICGIGEWRPERDGQYGMYHIETE